MAERQFDFTGALIDTSSLPTVVDASADSEVPNLGQVALRDTIAGPFVTKAALTAVAASTHFRVDNQVVFVDESQSFYYWDAASSAADDGDTVLQPDDTPATGRWIKFGGGGGGGSGSNILYQLHNTDSRNRVAETISDRDAVALVRFDQDGFLWCKAENDQPRFKESWGGFATAAATITQGAYTLTADAAFVTGNIIDIEVNGVPLQVTFASSSDETLQALADAISTVLDVDGSATDSVQVGADKLGNDDRVINVFSGNGKGGTGAITILIDNISVTGGASQPGLVFATVTTAASDTLDVRRDYDILDGFAASNIEEGGSVQEGRPYYVSDTEGKITAVDPGGGIVVGYGSDTDALLVEPPRRMVPADLEAYYRSHGSSTSSNAGGTATIERFNLVSSWNQSLNSAATGKTEVNAFDCSFQGKLVSAGGINTSGTLVDETQDFQANTWNTRAILPSVLYRSGGHTFGGKLYALGGQTSTSVGSATNALRVWNDTAWQTLGATFAGQRTQGGTFVQGSVLHWVAGATTGGADSSDHQTFDGTSTGTSTVLPTTATATLAGGVGSNGCIGADVGSGNDDIYVWSGSWGSAISLGRDGGNGLNGAASSAQIPGGDLFINGGPNTPTTNSERFNGSSISPSTASVQARRYGVSASI